MESAIILLNANDHPVYSSISHPSALLWELTTKGKIRVPSWGRPRFLLLSTDYACTYFMAATDIASAAATVAAFVIAAAKKFSSGTANKNPKMTTCVKKIVIILPHNFIQHLPPHTTGV